MTDEGGVPVENGPSLLYPTVRREGGCLYADHPKWEVPITAQEIHERQGVEETAIFLGVEEAANPLKHMRELQRRCIL